MMDLVARIRPVFDISYHSYSEVVLYPTGCEGTHAATRDVLEKFGHQIAAEIPTDDGQSTYAAGDHDVIVTAPDHPAVRRRVHVAEVRVDVDVVL